MNQMLTDTCKVCGSTVYYQRVAKHVEDIGWHHLSVAKAIRRSPVHLPQPGNIC